MSEPRRSYLQRAEEHEQFATLDFGEQQMLRSQALQRDFQENPELQRLEPEEQQAVFESQMQRPPVFENPELNTPEFREQLKNMSFAESGIYGMASGIANAGTLGGLIGKTLGEPVAQALFGAGANDVLMGSDADRMRQYIMNQSEYGSTARLSEGLWGATTGLHELGGYIATLGKGSAAAGANFGAKAFAGAKRGFNLPSALRWSSPLVSSSAAGGAYLTATRDAARQLQGHESEFVNDTGFDWENLARTYGWEFAKSTMYSFALGGIMLGARPLGRVFKPGDSILGDTAKATGKSQRELKRMIDAASEGRSPEGLEEMPTPFRDKLNFVNKTAQLTRDSHRLNHLRETPIDATRIEALKNQHVMFFDDVVEDGVRKFRYYELPTDGKNWTTSTFDNLEDLKMKMGSRVTDEYVHLLRHNESAAERFYLNNDNLIAWGQRSSEIDGIYEPSRKIASRVSAMKRQTPKGFLGADRRPYVSSPEAQRFSRQIQQEGGEGFWYTEPESVRYLDDIRAGKNPFTAAKTARFMPERSGSANVFAPAGRVGGPDVADEISAMVRKAQAAGTDLDAATLRKLYTIESGYDALRYADGSVEHMMPEKRRLITGAMDHATGKISTAAKVAKSGSAGDGLATEAALRSKMRADIPAESMAGDERLLASAATDRFKGTIASDDVANLSRHYLKRYGVDTSNISVKKSAASNRIDADGNMARITQKDGAIEVTVPKSITEADSQRKFVRELFDEYKRVADETAPAQARPRTGARYEKLMQQSSRRFEMPVDGSTNKKNWVDSIVRDQKGTMSVDSQGRYHVQLPGTEPARFDSAEQLYDELMLRSIDDGYLKFDLGRQGYKLTKTREGMYKLAGPGLDKPIETQTKRELMDEINYRPERIDDSLGPRVLEITPEATTIQFDGHSVSGGKKAILNHLAKFEDSEHVSQLKPFASLPQGNIYTLPYDGGYEVHIPKTASVMTFDSPGEARKFLQTDWDSFDGYARIARKKGLDFQYHDGAYHINDGSNITKAKTKEELYKVFQQYPDPQGGPDIFEGLNPQVAREVNQLIKSGQAPSAAKLPPVDDGPYVEPPEIAFTNKLRKNADVGASDIWRAEMENSRAFFEGLGDRHPALLEYYRRLETGLLRGAGPDDTQARKTIDAIFKHADGKPYTKQEARRITYFREAEGDAQKWNDVVTEWGEPTADDRKVMEAIGDLLGHLRADGTPTGWAAKFGITPETFEPQYMSRLRKWMEVNRQKLERSLTPEDILDDALDHKAASSLKPFFKHTRKDDLLRFAREDDPREILMTYSRLGNRELYLGDAWKGMQQYVNNHPELGSMKWRIEQYLESIAGRHKPHDLALVEQYGEEFYRAMGWNPQKGRELFQSGMSLTYLTNMAWRPYLSIRNTMQPWITLAPRFGNTEVAKAVDDVVRLGEEYFQKLKHTGIMPDAPPIVETSDSHGFINKVLQKALGSYKRSDEYTRAVAYRTMENSIDGALDKMKRGVITNWQEFSREAQLQKIAPDVRDQAMRLLKQQTPNAIESAKQTVGQHVVQSTMFGYRQSQLPGRFGRSLLGRMFGQYGTFSAGYRANLMEGLRYGSPADKAAFITRFVGNQSALFAGFTALGIEARNFIPGAPALFAGGPNFDLAMTALSTPDTGFRGRRARYELRRALSPVQVGEDGLRFNIPRQLPVFRQMAWLEDAYNYMDEGENWKAFLSATMTPVRRD